MKTVGITKLKAGFNDYVEHVKSGEEIIVTQHGRAVARMVPIDDTLAVDSRRMSLAGRGIIRPGNGSVSRDLLANLPVVNAPQRDIDRIIREEQEDRI